MTYWPLDTCPGDAGQFREHTPDAYDIHPTCTQHRDTCPADRAVSDGRMAARWRRCRGTLSRYHSYVASLHRTLDAIMVMSNMAMGALHDGHVACCTVSAYPLITIPSYPVDSMIGTWYVACCTSNISYRCVRNDLGAIVARLRHGFSSLPFEPGSLAKDPQGCLAIESRKKRWNKCEEPVKSGRRRARSRHRPAAPDPRVFTLRERAAGSVGGPRGAGADGAPRRGVRRDAHRRAAAALGGAPRQLRPMFLTGLGKRSEGIHLAGG
eukprot:gene14048-biopygen5314